MKAHGILSLCALATIACSRRAPPSPARVAPDPATVAAAPRVVAAVDAPAVDVAPAETTAAARIEALRALRPRVELVVEECEHHACVYDDATGLVRAVKGFTGFSPTARVGDALIVAVPRNDGSVETRYTGALWRWDLTRDILTRLTPRTEGRWETRVHRAHFGVIIEDDADSLDSRVRVWSGRGALPDAEATENPAHVSPALGTVLTVDGHTYDVGRGNITLAEMRPDGDGVIEEPIEGFAPTTSTGTLITGRGARAVVRLLSRERPARAEWMLLPSHELHSAELGALDANPDARIEGDALFVRDHARSLRVDLVSGAVTDLVPDGSPNADCCPVNASWLSVSSVFHDAMEFFVAPETARVDRAGITSVPSAELRHEPDAGVSCACEGDALACSDRRIEGACVSVEGAAPIADGSRNARLRTAAPMFLPRGAFRVDAPDLTLLRVTRLRDGARLWLRLVNGGILAQADDGAFTTSAPSALCAVNVRWGRGLLSAPVTRLAPHRASLERPTLVGDFFADRALPSADLRGAPTGR